MGLVIKIAYIFRIPFEEVLQAPGNQTGHYPIKAKKKMLIGVGEASLVAEQVSSEMPAMNDRWVDRNTDKIIALLFI